MQNSGKSIVDVGTGKGNNKINKSLDTVFSNNLLEEYDISKATKFILNITASDDISYEEIQRLVEKLREKLQYKEDTQIILGVNIDKNLKDEIKLTLIASGFED